jgi:hypothetical protein
MAQSRKFIVWGIVAQVVGGLIWLTAANARSGSGGSGYFLAWLLAVVGFFLLLTGVIAVGVRLGTLEAQAPPAPRSSNERLTLRR